MPEVPLAAQVGRPTGTRPSRRLRAGGRIPAVVYGRDIGSMAVSIDARELRVALSGDAGVNALLALEVDGTTHLTMAKEIQRHPVRGTVSHVDLMVVRRDEVVGADVPVVLTGQATEVERAGGVVDQQVFSLAIRSLPTAIPPAIEVDVSNLSTDRSIRLSEVSLPPGVSTDADPELTLVVGVPSRVAHDEAALAAAPGQGETAATEAPGQGAGTGQETAATGD